MDLSAELRALRAATNRTQEDVGEMARVSRGVVSLVERDLLHLVSETALTRIQTAMKAMRLELDRDVMLER
jgi:transcriptional regulator with XRE-family HTH domain